MADTRDGLDETDEGGDAGGDSEVSVNKVL